MAERGAINLGSDFDMYLEVATRLETAREDDPALAECDPGEMIRHVRGKRAILHCTLDDRPAVLRLGLTPNDTANAKTWAEMKRLWPYMSDGKARIAEPLHFSPDHDILIVAEVPGQPLLRSIRASDGHSRVHHLAPAAGWLQRATAMTTEWRPARPAPWLARAIAAATHQCFPNLRALETEIIDRIQTLAKHIEGKEWRVAICHGDLHPNNLILEGDRLTGIDIGGSSYLPIYKDMARFLMHMGRRDITLSGDWWMGVDRAGAYAFRDAFALDEFEFGTVFPFMLGVEALIRVETQQLPPTRIKRAERMYRRLLKDLSHRAENISQ